MELEEAIRCIFNGEAILFTGSGFSADAKKQDGSPLCTAKSFAHKLLADCGYTKDEYVDDLGQASDIYIEDKGSWGLLNLLKEEFTAEILTPEQQFLASLPWFRIYTTNYDNVLEKAFSDNGKKLNIAVLSDRQSDVLIKKNLCICLNGTLSNFCADKLTEEIKLTNRSYLTETFRNSPWLNLFQTDLKTAKAIFFVGYSMQYDLDIKRVVFNTEELRNKTFFIMWEKEPKINISLVKPYGTPFTIGLTGFVKKIKDEQQNYIPIIRYGHPLLCFDKVEISKSIPVIKNNDAFDLFLKGDSGNWDKVYYSLISPENIQFCVYRTKLNDVVNKIKNNSERNILIHSTLGNGKTIFLESLATLLSKQNFKVYYYQKYRTTIDKEIEQICDESGPSALIFDNYSDCMSYFKTIQSFRKDQILIVSERSALNDINYDKLSSVFGEFYTIELDELDNTEIEQLSNILTRYGLWQTPSNLRKDQKEEIISYKYCRSMKETILQVLRSPFIINKYKSLITEIKSKSGYYDALIYIFIAQVAGFKVDTDDLVNIFDATQLNSPTFRNNASVKEFVDFERDRVKGTSSLFAQLMLEEVFDSSIIVDVMISIFKQLNKLQKRPDVRNILIKMMTFRNIQNILNKKDKKYKENLKYYYNSIATLNFCAQNPHFWMQNAILMLSEYDYEKAEIYFNTAYSYAKNDGDFPTYKIDNHHARFILENECVYGTQETCMKAFASAHSVLMNPKHKDDSYYYPYRVAQKYYPFYEHFYSGMNATEQRTFLSACEEMLKRIEWYLTHSTAKEGRIHALRAKELMSRILAGK